MGRVGDDFLRLLGRQLGGHQGLALGGEHGIDKQAVAPGRGDAACRGVRAGNQAQLFEVGHDVADGRWRQLQAGRARQRARADGLTIGDITFYQHLEQQLGAIIEHPGILI